MGNLCRDVLTRILPAASTTKYYRKQPVRVVQIFS